MAQSSVTEFNDGSLSFKRAGIAARGRPDIPPETLDLMKRGQVESRDEQKLKADSNTIFSIDRDSPEARFFHMEPIENTFTKDSGEVLIRNFDNERKIPEQTKSRQIAFEVKGDEKPQGEFAKEVLNMLDRVMRLKEPNAEEKSFKVNGFEFQYTGETCPALKTKMATQACVVSANTSNGNSFGFDLRGTRNATHYNAQVTAISASEAELTVKNGSKQYHYKVKFPGPKSQAMINRECSFVVRIRDIVKAQMTTKIQQEEAA